MPDRQIRPLTLEEHRKVIEYFHSADDSLLEGMGARRELLIPEDEWYRALQVEFEKELRSKRFLYVGWEYDGELIGHSNVNNLTYGDWANIHLHMWRRENRERGLGPWFFKRSVNYFFEKLELQKIVCEPYAENRAPNRVFEKMGFTPVKKYLTTPGIICFEQYVNRYEITAPFELG